MVKTNFTSKLIWWTAPEFSPLKYCNSAVVCSFVEMFACSSLPACRSLFSSNLYQTSHQVGTDLGKKWLGFQGSGIKGQGHTKTNMDILRTPWIQNCRMDLNQNLLCSETNWFGFQGHKIKGQGHTVMTMDTLWTWSIPEPLKGFESKPTQTHTTLV